MFKYFGPLFTYLWCLWSNIRFKNVERFDSTILEIDKVSSLNDIQTLVRRLYSCFIWTADGIDQLGDAVTPPPQNYKIYKNKPLRDDCDGFHSLVYHCLHGSGIECYLLTANPAKMGQGHCVLIFKLNDRWHVNDYSKIYNGFTDIKDAIKNYNENYPIRYKTEKVVYNGIIKYDYDSGKFYVKNIDKLA